MTDKFKIDGHKLNYHIPRVNDWLEGRTVYPIYVEISPAGACNHRCSFCAVDYIGYQTIFLEKTLLIKRLKEMQTLGVKSVMFAGEGEPLLHKDLPEVICETQQAGIDISITTNAVPMTQKWIEAALASVTWIKTSINAGTPETYAEIHQTKKEDFDKVVSNLERAAEYKSQHNLKCALGSQMVLLPENETECVTLAKTMKSIGMNYLVIKPYSQHKKSITEKYKKIEYGQADDIQHQLNELNDDNFSVVFREKTMEKLLDDGHYYQKCYSTPNFWGYIMSNGSVYGCSAYLLDDRFCYGNINDNTFQEIWEGEKRKTNLEYIENELNISECRQNCRMDEVNRYLWDIKHPPEHVNFI